MALLNPDFVKTFANTVCVIWSLCDGHRAS